MINYKKLIEDLSYKGPNQELWYDSNNYIHNESNSSPLYIKNGFREKDIPFTIRLPLRTNEVSLSIFADFSTQAGYIILRPGNDINFSINIDTDKKHIEYSLTYHYSQNLSSKNDVALVLKIYTAFDFINLTKYLNVVPSDETYINNKFREAFSRVESDDEKLNWLYENAYPTALKLRGDEQLWTDMLRLSKYDGEKWFADTGSAIMNIACGFSNIEWIITKLKNNQQVIMNVYKTISDYDTKSSFAALIDAFIKIDGNDLYKPVFLTGKEYRLFKGSAKYNKNKQFNIVNQKETPKENKNLSWKEAIKEALSSSSLAPTQGGYAVAPQNNYNNIENEDLDPCDLVIIKDADLKVDRRNPVKTIPSAAIILYYIADNAEHELLMKILRISLDVAAILAAVYSGGTSSIVIRLAEAGMALTDIAMMSEEIRNFLSDNGGEWFVENWDTIYLMVGMGFLSNFIIRGILAKGPALLESLKNIRNVPKNWYLFRKDLEKLIKELEAYEAKQAARIATNEIAEVVIKGDKYGLWRKVLNLASSPEKYIETVVKNLQFKGISLKKVAEESYEIFYKSEKLIINSNQSLGKLLQKLYFVSSKNFEKVLYSYFISVEGGIFFIDDISNELIKNGLGGYSRYLKNLQKDELLIVKLENTSETSYTALYKGKEITTEVSKSPKEAFRKLIDKTKSLWNSKGDIIADQMKKLLLIVKKSKTMVNTSAKIGEQATAETIKWGTVKMQLHPKFNEIIQFLKDKNVKIIEVENIVEDVAYMELHVFDLQNNLIRTEKTLFWHPEMRFLDLEHEIDHIIQFEKNLNGKYSTITSLLKRAGVEVDRELPHLGFTTKLQKAFLEYEVRTREVFRLKERGIDKLVMEEHLEGLKDAYNTFNDLFPGHPKDRFKFESWRKEHFPDYEPFDFKNFNY